MLFESPPKYPVPSLFTEPCFRRKLFYNLNIWHWLKLKHIHIHVMLRTNWSLTPIKNAVTVVTIYRWQFPQVKIHFRMRKMLLKTIIGLYVKNVEASNNYWDAHQRHFTCRHSNLNRMRKIASFFFLQKGKINNEVTCLLTKWTKFVARRWKDFTLKLVVHAFVISRPDSR